MQSDSNLPPLPDSAVSEPQLETANNARRSRWRYALYLLALLGGLALTLVGWGVVEHVHAKRKTIDEDATISQVMTQQYGKYSEERKGWFYVDEAGQTYLMRVIQHANVDEGLYFVAASVPINSEQGNSRYGVFRAAYKPDAKDDSLFLTSSQFVEPGFIPLTPERVRFEALSEHVWGWVVKEQFGIDPGHGSGPVTARNVVIAPHGDDMAVLAEFMASEQNDPGMDCDEANRRYDAFVRSQSAPDAQASSADASANTVGTGATNSNVDPGDAPGRCSDAHWTYQVSPAGGDVPAPIYVSGKGMRNGKKLDGSTRKLMFDSKSYSYIVPEELDASSVGAYD
ncbi:hypothetical protein HT746_05745 [Burkholderia pyrrocinia]|uniref:hypothetical protein n=1 Tax=Burkholderia pyrrocinia TaxID=60550 RepID=UPI001575557B|nr:hypothetical protein [Burkholderia pyrrocinia]NTX26646.1 hypothetical protein [Burkholderia pyrrocinia]